MKIKSKLKVKPYFKWFDFWVGWYFDVEHKAFYLGYFPMCGLKFYIAEVVICPSCHLPATKSACYADNGYWSLSWWCLNTPCDQQLYKDINWHFGKEIMSESEIKKFGYEIFDGGSQ